ncbi:MAG: sigma 54-interacting transcriptional regulator [Desulfuromonadales bacterium]|nr:sigma 54-interacting transcriptional regulator [Desulfuromonadales bacterium]
MISDVRNSDKFAAIVSSMAEGVIFLDENDVIRVCNPAAERIRRIRAEKIVGQSIYTIHPKKVHTQISELLTGLKADTISSSNRTVHVNRRFFDNTYSSIRDEEGRYLGTLLVSRDVTENRRLAHENLNLKHSLVTSDDQMIFQSEAMRRLIELVDAVAELESTLLITGENGTGKERVVERLHQRSLRSKMPLVRVNCAALPENLIESELFGHLKGAFTGAVEDRRGKFVSAEAGTLFLDEIGELPLVSQAKLLRAIQEKSVQPIGGRKEIRVDVRIIAATNRDLTAEVAAGRFREDLFYRLNVIQIEVPPLRERAEDIIPLAREFMSRYAEEMKRPVRVLSPQVRAMLLAHPFPGNVRQLKHAMERAVALGKGDEIQLCDLPPEMTQWTGGNESQPPGYQPGVGLKQALGCFERQMLIQALDHHQGRRSETARSLGISRKSLWERMQRHALTGTD